MKRIGTLSTLVAGALLVLTAGPALASDSAISIGSKAAYLARGAAVQVSVTYTCTPAPSPWNPDALISDVYLSVTISQAVKKGMITSASGEFRVPCTGAEETATVVMTASERAFVKGPAMASAHGYDVDMSGAIILPSVQQVIAVK